MSPGDRLEVLAAESGARCYLAVKGGWQTAPVLGSRSCETRLRAGEIVPASARTTSVRRPAEPTWRDPVAGPLRVVDGPDVQAVAGLDALIHGTWRVSGASDRMGLRLDGPPLAGAPAPNRVSTPIAPGAVQLAGGQLIVLGVACGTMGGYPHVAHVISADLDRLGQLRPGDPVRFQRLSVAEARRLDQLDRNARASLFRRLAAVAKGEDDAL
jgi:allophanate hydrolase subunit 2